MVTFCSAAEYSTTWRDDLGALLAGHRHITARRLPLADGARVDAIAGGPGAFHFHAPIPARVGEGLTAEVEVQW
jgi:hypothetical protein